MEGNFLANFRVLDLVEKIVDIGVLGPAKPNTGLDFGLQECFTVYWLVFNVAFVQIADLSALNNAGSKKCHNFLFALPGLTQFCLKLAELYTNCIFFYLTHTSCRVQIRCRLDIAKYHSTLT